MCGPGKAEMVQQHVQCDLGLQFRALVDGQGHQALAQDILGDLGQFMADKDRARQRGRP